MKAAIQKNRRVVIQYSTVRGADPVRFRISWDRMPSAPVRRSLDINHAALNNEHALHFSAHRRIVTMLPL